jgi:hypothetical protein
MNSTERIVGKEIVMAPTVFVFIDLINSDFRIGQIRTVNDFILVGDTL